MQESEVYRSHIPKFSSHSQVFIGGGRGSVGGQLGAYKFVKMVFGKTFKS